MEAEEEGMEGKGEEMSRVVHTQLLHSAEHQGPEALSVKKVAVFIMSLLVCPIS